MLEIYKQITPDDLRSNLIEFLREITPVAEEEGARLCIHADDPAFPLFGLPRVMSTAADVRAMFEAVPIEACGLTLCTGSFGSIGATTWLRWPRNSPRAFISSICATRRTKLMADSMKRRTWMGTLI